MADRELIVREAEVRDVRRIVDAYERWKAFEKAQGNEDFVLSRPEDDLVKAASRGLLLLVEDARTGQILAVTGTFDLRGEPDVTVELGGTYVDVEIRERGMQNLFFEIRVGVAMILNGAKVRITTAINPNNGDSYRNAVKKNCFQPMAPIPEQTGDACNGCDKPKLPETGCCCTFFDISLENARELARRFLARTEHGTTVSMGPPGKQVLVHLRCQAATDPDFNNALRSFASGDWPKP